MIRSMVGVNRLGLEPYIMVLFKVIVFFLFEKLMTTIMSYYLPFLPLHCIEYARIVLILNL